MVIAQLVGGLGNQLFQYATARAIAYRNRVPLRLDTSPFQHYPDREYKLHHFNITASTISPETVDCLTRQNSKSRLRRLFYLARRQLPLCVHATIEEQQYHFDRSVLEIPGNIYLIGYWQSEKYFKDIEAVLREELVVTDTPNAENVAMSRLINHVQAVSLHIRRGDYVSNPATYQHHGVCSPEYYHAAVEKVAQTVREPHFFVFSDDIEWAQHNLRLEYPVTYVTHNGIEKDYEDLRLMSQCSHHIIANSSFSWWGAWLCTDPEQIVVTPQRWFRNPDRDAQDIVPEAWHRI